MKLSHLSILFVGIMVMLCVTTDIRTDNLKAMADAKNDMDFYMDQAMESTVETMMQVDSTGIETMNMDKAVDIFFSSMFASLGILSDPVAQERFRAYVPVIAVTAEDGYYLMYSDEYLGTDGYSYISRRWTEKMPYSYEDDDFIYRFSLGTDAILFDKNNIMDPTGTVKLFDTNALAIRTQEEYAALRTRLSSGSFLIDEEGFSLVRQQAIITQMEKNISWYLSRHNDIAAHFGITYQFNLPVASTSDWAKTIEGPGIIIVFQGMPLIEDATKVYNRMAFSGAGVRKGRVYYIEQDGWYYLYHLEGCRMLEGNLNIRKEHYYSVKQCSEMGCFACPICDPLGVAAPNYTP